MPIRGAVMLTTRAHSGGGVDPMRHGAVLVLRDASNEVPDHSALRFKGFDEVGVCGMLPKEANLARRKRNSLPAPIPWHSTCDVEYTEGQKCPVFFPTEAAMSAKKRRKVYGVRRETRRPRGWTRWFNEGLLDLDVAGSVRLRSVLWEHK